MDINYIVIYDTQIYNNNSISTYIKKANFMMQILEVLKNNSCTKSTLTIIPFNRIDIFETEMEDYIENKTYDYLLQTLQNCEQTYNMIDYCYYNDNNNNFKLQFQFIDNLFANMKNIFTHLEKIAYNARPESKNIVLIYTEYEQIQLDIVKKIKNYDNFNCFTNFSTFYLIKTNKSALLVDDRKDYLYFYEEHEINSDNKMLRLKLLLNNYLVEKIGRFFLV